MLVEHLALSLGPEALLRQLRPQEDRTGVEHLETETLKGPLRDGARLGGRDGQVRTPDGTFKGLRDDRRLDTATPIGRPRAGAKDAEHAVGDHAGRRAGRLTVDANQIPHDVRVDELAHHAGDGLHHLRRRRIRCPWHRVRNSEALDSRAEERLLIAIAGKNLDMWAVSRGN